MKFSTLFALVLSAFVQASSAHAMVTLKESCVTSDGKYKVLITDNQGIGFPRVSHLVASITDEQDNVLGEYEVEFKSDKIHSISFGHANYVDTASQGKDFTFALPSTNTPKAVIATLSNGEKIVYGERFALPGVNQGGLSCAGN